ncbi:MAG TPA: SpoIIE family protein phosphatase [Bryobacteraceae bacterium]|nr:SpoIIE family protein phosphatase [Bryobacteraceae bacterium]
MLAAFDPKPTSRKPGRIETLFLVSLVIYLILLLTSSRSLWTTAAQFLTMFLGAWLIVRVAREGLRNVIWRLRNRLLVTYLFIAAVPILLIATLGALGASALIHQVAVYLVTSELDRRIASLRSAAQSIERAEPSQRTAVMQSMADLFYRERFPGVEFLLRESSSVVRYPEGSHIEAPPPGWKTTTGLVRKGGRFYIWSYARMKSGDITILAPVTREFLDHLVPNLGVVYFAEFGEHATQKRSGDISSAREVEAPSTTEAGSRDQLPPPVNRLDVDFTWFTEIPASVWEIPNKMSEPVLAVRSRPSAILDTFYSRSADRAQNALLVLLAAVAALFVIAEVVSLIIGISMTRTITGAVHHLYEGTRRVMQGDFSHRIEVKGDDQLADLSSSFNQMTENLERLLVVAKEKERLQSEIKIAREVQSQLYPKTVPQMRTLRLTAVCKPARMVSGDYYDYESLLDSKVALAIGDVAGKGISAALLMATLQSSMRAQLRSSLEAAAVATGGSLPPPPISTSLLVSRLNRQLYATTSPEKYATFYLGLFDEITGWLTYTNAGHLPPILVSDGVVSRLDVNGTVVGAFPHSQYEESRVELLPGDFLACFTDGISEPENEYGEMFGEERLAGLLATNAHRDGDQIVEIVMEAVEQWTGGGEQQDDMTILLARRQ